VFVTFLDFLGRWDVVCPDSFGTTGKQGEDGNRSKVCVNCVSSVDPGKFQPISLYSLPSLYSHVYSTFYVSHLLHSVHLYLASLCLL
jgi:hypothetical protein